MKKSRFTERQIVAILKEADGDLKVAEVCCKHGISQPSYYGGMGVAELKRVKELEAEYAKLKRMYADLAMENDALKELIEKALTPAGHREAVDWLVSARKMAACRACRAMKIDRSWRHRPRVDEGRPRPPVIARDCP